VKYNSNEIYFDMVEEMRAVVDRYVYHVCTGKYDDGCKGMERRSRVSFGVRLRQIVDCQVTRSGHVCLALLSNVLGTPDLVLSLRNPHVLTDCSFHPCVRYVSFSGMKLCYISQS
jgi:AP-3 complex subunit mu